MRLASTFRASHPEIADKVVFVLCGKGTKKDVRAMASLDVTFITVMSHKEMFEIYAAADVYADFTRRDGYNMSIAQAIAMGLPVIASDTPAHREFPGQHFLYLGENLGLIKRILLNCAAHKNSSVRSGAASPWSFAVAQLGIIIKEVCQDKHAT
jgi:hypothetical protein